MSGIEAFFRRPLKGSAKIILMPIAGDLDSEYLSLYNSAEIRKEHLGEVSSCAGHILENKAQYDHVQSGSTVPWFVVGAIHSLEANFNFNHHLHNGDPLTARTTHEPAGRPVAGQAPFAWYESAIDAMNLKAKPKAWDVPGCLSFLEHYNGFGYRKFHSDVLSPYLWSFTNKYTSGKYKADGSWDQGLVSAQVGAVAVIKLLEQRGVVEFKGEAS